VDYRLAPSYRLGMRWLTVAVVMAALSGAARIEPDARGASSESGVRNGLIAFTYHPSVSAVRNGKWGDVYTIDARVQALRRIVARAGSPAWAPDGTRLAVNNSGGNDMRVLKGAPSVIVTDVWGPSWAPDGARVVGMQGTGAFVRIENVRTGAIYTIYEDEGNGFPECGEPAWSPRGRLIALVCLGITVGAVDEVTFFDTRRNRFVGRSFPGRSPAWSPDANRVAFVRGSTRRPAVFVSRLDGSRRRLLARHASEPAFSPDGRKIAFVRWVSAANSAIFVMNADGTHQRRLTNLPGVELAPSWQPMRG
jgi:hypothetical protein